MQIRPDGPRAVGPSAPMSMASPMPTHMGGTLDGIAGMLGLSTDALRSSLGAGSSLADVAATRGVGRDDLVSSMERMVQDRRASQGLAPVDEDVLHRIATRAADRGGSRQAPSAPDPLGADGLYA